MLERTLCRSEILVKLDMGMARYNHVQCGVKSSWWQFLHSFGFRHEILSYWIPNSWVITCNDLNLAHIPLEKFSCLWILYLVSVFSVAAKQVMSLQSVIQWTLLLSTFLCFSERSIIATSTVRLALHMPFEFCLHIVEKWSEMATTTVTEHGQILV